MSATNTTTNTSSNSRYAACSAEGSAQRTRLLFGPPATLPPVDLRIRASSVARRKRVRLGEPEYLQQQQQQQKGTSSALVVSNDATTVSSSSVTFPSATSTALARLAPPQKSELNNTTNTTNTTNTNDNNSNNRILVKHRSSAAVDIPTPTWHAPWNLSTVLSSHLGWVRSIALDPNENRLMATGSADRTIKIWNFPKASAGADDALQYTLTGHISAIRGLAFSDRHPYLFSCAEDKQVKCWDLETNQVVRHYHGHLSGVFCLALHPTVDVLVTAGRDAVARVWDIRSKKQVHCLTGHEHTVGAVLCQSTHPQVITGSQDSTVKLWDLVAGRCVTTLTHHQKGVRALVQPTFERTFVSGAADCLKKWQSTNGRFLNTIHRGLDATNSNKHQGMVHALAVNDQGVLVSGGDDGSMNFWDYQSGYPFQQAQAKVQPGSLDSENSIMALAFDGTGTRLVTGEADKTIKIWKQDQQASELTHPIDMPAWRKKCIAQAKQRY